MINIQYLRLLVLVREHKTLGLAGQAHNVSQSAVTQAIHRLEREVGVELVDRSTRPLRLTAQGQAFCVVADRIVKLYDAALAQIQDPNSLLMKRPKQTALSES